ncbi:MAG TPA: Stp1/IreP family PP2C-type Ser/Thr phosphatase [Humisphaera sp.]
MTLRILHAGLTDTGRVRPGNEDAWAVDASQGLYIVADGMGGHAAGEIAARLVVESLPKMVRKRVPGGGNAGDGSVDGDSPAAAGHPPTSAALARRLRSAVSRLSRDVYETAMTEPGLRGMGATVVAAMVRGSEAVVVHMGDSRAYLLRGGKLKLLTKDHSVVQALIDAGQITPEEAETHPARNRITASVGMPGDPTPDSKRVDLQPGDKLLLCTDGLAGMIPDEEIRGLLDRRESPAAACQTLIDAANAAGGHDNITAVVIEFQEPHDVDAGAASSG